MTLYFVRCKLYLANLSTFDWKHAVLMLCLKVTHEPAFFQDQILLAKSQVLGSVFPFRKPSSFISDLPIKELLMQRYALCD